MWRFTLNFSFYFFTSAILLSGCNTSYQEITTQTAIPSEVSHLDDSILIEKSTGLSFSRIHKKESMGLRVPFLLPDNLKGKELYVVFNGIAKSNYAYSNASIVVSVYNTRKQQIIWKSFPLRYNFLGVDVWSPFTDSLYLSGSFDNKNYLFIQTFSFLGNSESEKLDMTYLTVKLKAKLK